MAEKRPMAENVTQNVAIRLKIRSHVACDANRDYRTEI